MRIIFGSFGCRDDFRDCKRDDFRNVLRNISIGPKISLLRIKHDGSFRNVIFEGFSCGVALFSNQDNRKDWDDDGKCNNNSNRNKFRGLLRVCPEDIIAIAI
ncbi:DUF3915 family protein [Bacillus sp. DX4.1]|uniref:DUF3915 family protein n=1 Tax=Bacillus sp. DX4.1 TaxID=3055867 RepID=UPI0025A0E0C7|nr:DUF3915 family protein [Bacillus sp. DX4.1]MDM5189753.1 DUF3915 family protein [Bacillus sp. DX4.1]